jgi:hypothetical protein
MTTPTITKTAKSATLTPRSGIEEETLLANRTLELADAAVNGITNGAMKSSEANVLLGAGRLIFSVAKQSITNRTARGRLQQQEAKMVEHESAG